MTRAPNLTNVAFALGSVAFDSLRLPARAVLRAPGMRRLSAEGGFVRARVRSRVDGIAEDAVDWLLAGPIPDAVARSALEHRIAERIALELAESIDVEAAVVAAIDHETTQRMVSAVIASEGFDRVLLEATDRALRGPEMERVIEHVASSASMREAMTRQGTTLAGELADNVRGRAESVDEATERKVHRWLRRPDPA